MRRLIHGIVLSAILTGVGCALFLSKETRYLSSAKNKASEDEVRQHLGSPANTNTGRDGKDIWIYDRREFVQGGNVSYEMDGKWWCDRYELHFDAQGILQDWTHRPQAC